MYYLPDSITPIVMPPPGRVTPATRFAVVRWTPDGASLPSRFATLNDCRRFTRGRGGIVRERMARVGQPLCILIGPRGRAVTLFPKR